MNTTEQQTSLGDNAAFSNAGTDNPAFSNPETNNKDVSMH